MAFVTIKREFRRSDIYRKSKCEQREVLWTLIWRVQFEAKPINFGGVNRILELGELWVSRKGLVRDLHYAGVKDSHVRYMLEKLVNNDFLGLVITSRSGGSIYRCLPKFFREIAEPFDLRKVKKTTNEQPTDNQRITNEQPTNNQPNQLSVNGLNDFLTNEQPTNNQRITNEQPTNNLNKTNNPLNNQLINEMIEGNSDFNSENSLLNNHSIEEERKKVPQKKETEFPAVENVGSPLSLYINNPTSITFWEKKYPKLDIREEFEKIIAKRGDDPVANLYSFVRACLKNALIYNQSPKATKNQKYEKSNNWAKQNGKRIDASKFDEQFANIGASGLIQF